MACKHVVAVAVGNLKAPNTKLAWRFAVSQALSAEGDSLVVVRCVSSQLGSIHAPRHDGADMPGNHTVLSESKGPPWTSELLSLKYEWIDDEMRSDIATRFPLAVIVEIDAEGGIGDGILSWLKCPTSPPVDTLVLGSRGLSKLRKFLLGSVSSYVVKHAPCSVVVVRESAGSELADSLVKEERSGPRSVVLCLDGSGEIGERLCAWATRHLLRPTDIVALIHSPYKTKKSEARKATAEAELKSCKKVLASFLEDPDANVEAVLLDLQTDPRDSIVDFVDSLRPAGGCDLVVVSSQAKPSGLARMVLGSTAAYVTEHAKSPCCVVTSSVLKAEDFAACDTA